MESQVRIHVRMMLGEGVGTPLQYSCLGNSMNKGAWWAAVHGVVKSRTGLSDFTFTFHFPALEKEMATHSSVLAWRIPGTGEPGGLPSMGLHRVRDDWCDWEAAARMMLQALGIFTFTACHTVVSLSHCLRQAWLLSVSGSQLSSWDLTSLSLGFPLYTPGLDHFFPVSPFLFGEVKPTWLAAGTGVSSFPGS